MTRSAKISLGERGVFNTGNKLNDLTGKEWIKFTKSWFVHRPPRRMDEEILHPAKFPESLAKEFIQFFSKPGAWVFDPFLGTGSTLIACYMAGRNGFGIELNKKYWTISKKRVEKLQSDSSATNHSVQQLCHHGNSHDLNSIVNRYDELNGVLFDYCITSPPYWDQLRRNTLRQKTRKTKGFDTTYSRLAADIGNIENYEEFLQAQAEIFDYVYDVVKRGAYLTVITNNVYADGRLYPLAYDTAVSLTRRGKKSWVLKDERIWLQDDKALVALGVNSAWVGNRHHQYCLNFRKEV